MRNWGQQFADFKLFSAEWWDRAFCKQAILEDLLRVFCCCWFLLVSFVISGVLAHGSEVEEVDRRETLASSGLKTRGFGAISRLSTSLTPFWRVVAARFCWFFCWNNFCGSYNCDFSEVLFFDQIGFWGQKNLGAAELRLFSKWHFADFFRARTNLQQYLGRAGVSNFGSESGSPKMALLLRCWGWSFAQVWRRFFLCLCVFFSGFHLPDKRNVQLGRPRTTLGCSAPLDARKSLTRGIPQPINSWAEEFLGWGLLGLSLEGCSVSAQGFLSSEVSRLRNLSTEEFLGSRVPGHPRVVSIQGCFLAGPIQTGFLRRLLVRRFLCPFLHPVLRRFLGRRFLRPFLLSDRFLVRRFLRRFLCRFSTDFSSRFWSLKKVFQSHAKMNRKSAEEKTAASEWPCSGGYPIPSPLSRADSTSHNRR